MPTSLRLQRDDRQARLFYMEERKRLKDAAASAHSETPAQIQHALSRSATGWSEAKWISISVNGKLYDVLADPDGNVLSSKLKGDAHAMPSDAGDF